MLIDITSDKRPREQLILCDINNQRSDNMPGNNQLSNIIEDNKIAKFLSFVSYDTSVILFDIDNTIGWPGTYLGSDQWFVRLFDYLGQFITNDVEKTVLAVAIYYEVQQYSQMQAVESQVVYLIQRLQSIGYQVMAITSRGDKIEQATYQQLTSLGLDFDDIIFCNGRSKGEELLRWINDNQPNWKKAVMIDDKEKHLHSVSQALSLLGISFQGLRYSKMDTFFDQENNCNNVHQSLKTFSLFSERIKASLAPIFEEYTQVLSKC